MIQILIFGIDIYTEKNFILDLKKCFLKLQFENSNWSLNNLEFQYFLSIVEYRENTYRAKFGI